MRLLFLLFILGLVQGECPAEVPSIAPRPYTKPEKLPVCEAPYLNPNCTCPSSKFECACHKFGQCNGRPGCLPKEVIYNRANDCGDWSDEFWDSCPDGKFQCACFNTSCKNSYGCVPLRSYCNGYLDCIDGSDEVNCSCPEDTFECACYKTKTCSGKYGCVDKKLQCNRRNNCGDWSDEADCPCPANTFDCKCHKTNNCTLATTCVENDDRCNGINNCGDWSDEDGCNCPGFRFQCACFKTKNCTSFYGCIPPFGQCNGRNDCGDWSDEVNCTCPANKFQCACYQSKTCTASYGCIGRYRKCNGRNDCGDWSDEVNCTCPANKFQCACYQSKTCTTSYGCIRRHRHCDGRNDCGDLSDEVNCSCPANKFQCACYKTNNCKRTGCIRRYKKCNGRNDCGDWSDEIDCACGTNMFECECYKTNTCTFSNGCIRKYQQCNGRNDCGDWSDELNCNCSADRFECPCYKSQTCDSRYGCIPREWTCDGGNNCGDWSDEVNCTCPSDTFECPCYKTNDCRGSFGCISSRRQCDRFNDCGDWSDEVNCTCPPNTFECACYKTNNCSSNVGCIIKLNVCNGRNDCGDLSDEVNCSCPARAFECACYKTANCPLYTGGCVSKDRRCDSFNACGDWSDEAGCTCPDDKFQCACLGSKQCIGTEGSCIDSTFYCDGKPDCIDGSDELACNCSGVYARCPCDRYGIGCPLSGRCIPFDWLGNQVKDCSDESDEVCSVSNVTCQSCTLLVTSCKSEEHARYLVHSKVPPKCNTVVSPTCADDINNCGVERWVCVTELCEKPADFCLNLFICENREFIPYNYFCDGISDSVRACSDNTDEIREGFGFKCSGSTRQGLCVLPQINVYDSVPQCSDNSDLCFLNGQFKCFRCLDKKMIISPKQVCDGVVDCFDMSDECLCFNRSLCDELKNDCPPNQMYCHNRSVCIDNKDVLCNSSVPCSDQINTKYCLLPESLKQTQCLPKNITGLGLDKLFKCVDADNKILRSILSKDLKRAFKQDVSIRVMLGLVCDGKYEDLLGLVGEIDCRNTFFCFSNGKFYIKNNQVCDGKVDCDDGSDEYFKLCRSTRHYCETEEMISVPLDRACDSIVDCYDKSDENKCLCEKRRFFCKNKQPLSVELKLVQNGIDDCSDGSDECVNLAGDVLADVNEMISNPLYRGIFWLTGALALCGNLFVFIATVKSLFTVKRDQNVFINTSVFILNLCFSDFLMGIYLLAVVVQGNKFSGSYCLHDKEWRSSILCSGLGALAVLSSEASALTMTAMTTFRLISAFKPFAVQTLGVGKVVLAELFCWILSAFLATVPLFHSASGYFTTDVWFPNNFFDSDFVSRENMSILAERIEYRKLQSWNEVKQTIHKAFPRNFIKGEFGYYGETSVCMPRFFATASEYAWEYSAFLITINFLMFIYMVIAYVLIYKQSNNMKGSRSIDISSKMQKRISRLIVTDFCCWIPVCIMGYLSFGGIKMPPDAYVLSACLLLPINSALNPLLYSKVIEDQWSAARKWLAAKLLFLRSSTNRSSDLSVRYNRGPELGGDGVVEIME